MPNRPQLIQRGDMTAGRDVRSPIPTPICCKMSRWLDSSTLRHADAHLMSVWSDSPDLHWQRRSNPSLKIRWWRHKKRKKKKERSQQTLGGWERLPNKHSYPCLRFFPTYNWLCTSGSSQHSDLFIKGQIQEPTCKA